MMKFTKHYENCENYKIEEMLKDEETCKHDEHDEMMTLMHMIKKKKIGYWGK